MLLLENISHEDLKKYLKEFYTYALERLKKIDRDPKVIFKYDQKNADNFFGKTGYYDPDEEKIVLYVSDRHAKDVLRSFAHELIHHYQKCTGESDTVDLSATSDPSYALHNDGLREMEKMAFKWGNMLFRDWCDIKKMERKNNMTESKKDLVELVLERVTERLITESKGTDIPKKDEPEFKKKKKQIHKAIAKKGGKKPKDSWAVASEKAAEFVGAKPKGTDKPTVKKEEKFPKSMSLEKAKEMGIPPEADVKDDDRIEGWEAARSEKIQKSLKKEDDSFTNDERKEKLEEAVAHPYPELLNKKERLFSERFSQYEQWKFEELLKRAIKK
jgi:hypothetical protein